MMRPFNPSLVRLAPMYAILFLKTTHNFQSQLGSIGASRVAAGVAVISVRFQSQLGSIGAMYPRDYFAAAVTFQSQLGSIGAVAASSPGDVLTLLSIPAWFDWRR